MPVKNPGLFNHSITIQQRAVTGQGTRGEDVFTWTTYCSCNMQVRALTNREVNMFAQAWPNAQSILEGYWISGVTTEMRAYDSCCTRTLDIKASSDPDGKREVLQLLAQEVTA